MCLQQTFSCTPPSVPGSQRCSSSDCLDPRLTPMHKATGAAAMQLMQAEMGLLLSLELETAGFQLYDHQLAPGQARCSVRTQLATGPSDKLPPSMQGCTVGLPSHAPCYFEGEQCHLGELRQVHRAKTASWHVSESRMRDLLLPIWHCESEEHIKVCMHCLGAVPQNCTDDALLVNSSYCRGTLFWPKWTRMTAQ